MSRFCLHRVAIEAVASGVETDINIQCRNALSEPWNEADLVLMNPPFVAWNKMDSDDRRMVVETLGEIFSGHADKAMAFVWKAVKTLPAGGVLACVIPSPLLESNSGERWREAL